MSLASGDSFLALVDTGFNDDLYMTVAVATSLGIGVPEDFEYVELAGGVEVKAATARSAVRWLTVNRTVDVFVVAEGKPGRPFRDGDPVALAGTGLLHPHLILLDFEAGTVEIERQ
jgi:predicted aspartyl protease